MKRPRGDESESLRRPSLGQQLVGTMFDGTAALDLRHAPAPTHTVDVRAHLRTLPGPATPSGVARKEAALSAHEASDPKARALAYVREQLRDLYRSRAATWPAHQVAYVNADDADRILRSWPQYPVELHTLGNNWRGSIFRGAHWKIVTGADQPSLRAHLHGTSIPGWKYVEGDA
jgi:hypothetical protein